MYNGVNGINSQAPARRVFITGASSGIGRALSLRLAREGEQVFASARSLEKLAELASEGEGRIFPSELDVTKPEAVASCITQIETVHGPIDIAILNAGDYRPMPAAEFDAGLCRHLIEVNYFGVVHCVDALLPGMVARKSGELLLMCSVAGYRGLPLGGPYGASKAAVCVLAESLHAELQGSGVNVRVINPGFVKTALTAQNPFEMPALIEVGAAAERIFNALGRPGFEITFPKRFTYLLKAVRALPYALWFPLIRKVTGAGQ